MFTLIQIKNAHSKVKSGADFPAYVQDLIHLGIKKYDAFTADGHSIFFGENHEVESEAKYSSLEIASNANIENFKSRLKAHQLGETDYMTFCNDAAENGVEKWTVEMENMTCTYKDKSGNALLVEIIPGI